jgi:hypothetical protein
MSIRFHSRATAPLLMLKRDGARILQVLGEAGSGKGILQVHEIAGAIEALERAAHQELQEADSPAERQASEDAVTLRQRVTPLIAMLRRSEAEGEPVLWEA